MDLKITSVLKKKQYILYTLYFPIISNSFLPKSNEIIIIKNFHCASCYIVYCLSDWFCILYLSQEKSFIHIYVLFIAYLNK